MRRRRRGKWAWEDRRASIPGVTYPTPDIVEGYRRSLACYDALHPEIRKLIQEYEMVPVRIYDSGHRDPEVIKMIMRQRGYNV